MNLNDIFNSTKSGLPTCACTDFYCSTCGGQISRIKVLLNSEDKEDVFNFLYSLSFSNFERYDKYHNWRMYVGYLLTESAILLEEDVDEIISHWESRLLATERSRFYDFIMYYFLRYLPESNRTKTAWITRCVDVINETGSKPLTETLVIVLGQKCPVHILQLAKKYAEDCPQMQRALVNCIQQV